MANISQKTIAELQLIRTELRRILARANRLQDSDAFDNGYCVTDAYRVVDHVEYAILAADEILYDEADIESIGESLDVSDVDLGLSPSGGGSITGF